LCSGLIARAEQLIKNILMLLDDFKTRLLSEKLEDMADELLLSGVPKHFSEAQINLVVSALATKYGIGKETITASIVGSAKLGFSLLEKWDKETRTYLPQFRLFSANSDVDVAIVSPTLFRLIWGELSTHADHTVRMPWNSGQLGDYMVHGWLRPDHFPKNCRLTRCDDWWDVFRNLTSKRISGLRPIRGALYYSHEQLRRYQIRGLKQSQSQLMRKP
jgi:hypothetical protein